MREAQRRRTGLPPAAEWLLEDLFTELTEADRRGQRIYLPALHWSDQPDGVFLGIQIGPLRVMGQFAPAYCYIDSRPGGRPFDDVQFIPGGEHCLLFGGGVPSVARIYPEDPGPWWDLLAGALDGLAAAVDAALAAQEIKSGRQRQLDACAAAVRAYQGGSCG